MKRSHRAVFLLMMLASVSCSKKENKTVSAWRLPEDTISITEILNRDDPAQARVDFDAWLETYPGEVNRVHPREGATALGLASGRYFQAEGAAKEGWREMIAVLLEKGADPNVIFTFKDQRRGLVHLALERGDLGFVKFLVTEQGTLTPPLRQSCSLDQAPRNRLRDNSQRLPLDLNRQEDGTGLSPLHYAIKNKALSSSDIEYLLLQGANPDLADGSLNLLSPSQLVASDPDMLSVFQKFSGAQARYDARLNSLINEEIEAPIEQRKTILDLARSYQDFVSQEGFQDVQDINRVIELCETGEELNLLGYAVKYILPSISTRVAQVVKVRNDSIETLVNEYGAAICLDRPLRIKNAENGEGEDITLKDFFRKTLAQHSEAAIPPVKNFNKTLWCNVLQPKAREGGCWDPALDAELGAGISCASP